MAATDRGTKKILLIGTIVLLIAGTSGGIGYYFGAHNSQPSFQMGKNMKGMPNGKKPSSKNFKN